MASPRRPEIRRDPVFSRWVLFSPARSRRPSDFRSKSPNPSAGPNSCPFCRGREGECAPEIFRLSDAAGEWKVRVIENLYPALRRDEEPPAAGEANAAAGGDPWRQAVVGFGFHDVVIETPTHSVHLPDLSAGEVGDVVVAYKRRIEQLKLLGSIKYVQVFKNHGASAGASMTHSHSQIIGLPLVPSTVSTRLDSMKEFFHQTGKCGLCQAHSEDLLIDESTHFFSIVPPAASFPFEIWIIPRDHESYFHDIDIEKAVDFGGLLKLMLLKQSRQLNDPPFNFMIHTSPFQLSDDCLPYAHWFLQIVPQLTTVGGFETGSGCYINPVFPEDAAKVLREVNCPI